VAARKAFSASIASIAGFAGFFAFAAGAESEVEDRPYFLQTERNLLPLRG
jgi:hypothetical protein